MVKWIVKKCTKTMLFKKFLKLHSYLKKKSNLLNQSDQRHQVTDAF